MKLLKRILLGILIFLCLFIGAGFFIAYFYEDEVKNFVVKEINKQLVAEVKVGDIEFSVLRKFPFASLIFSDVSCPSAYKDLPAGLLPSGGKSDTLYTAKKIFLQFNIIDVFHKNYTIKKIQVNDASLNIRIDKDRNDNFHFWKSPTTDHPEEDRDPGFSFEINELLFVNTHVSYIDQTSDQDISFTSDKALIIGEFSDENYSLYTNCNILIHHIEVDNIYYLKEQPFIAELDLHVNNTDKSKSSYNIEDGTFEIAGLNFNISGDVIYLTPVSSNKEKGKGGENSYDLDLIINAKYLDIQTIISVLPGKYKDNFSGYNSTGQINIESFIKGEYSDKKSPSTETHFAVKNGEVIHDSTGFTLYNIDLKGFYEDRFTKSQRFSKSIEIQEFSAQLEDGNIAGKITIHDFENPIINLSLNSQFQLAGLYSLFNTDTIQSMDGDITIDASFKGKIKNTGNYTPEDLKEIQVSGIMDISDLFVHLKNNPLEFNDINGSLVFNDNDIFIKDMTGSLSNSDLQLEGYFKNILPYLLLPGKKLFVDADLNSKNIDLNELLLSYTSSETDTAYALKFSDNIDFNLNLNINNLIFRRFGAKDIKGTLKLKNKKLIANALSFSSMDGQVLANGIIDGTHPGKLLITCDATINKIDIRELFYEFENFGQDVINDKHLKGIATAGIQFASVWNHDLTVDLNKIYTKADVTITRGELINFEPMMELSEFIEVAELKHIKFSTMQNQIEIKNQEIHIPKMEINSSALNVTLSGTHTFNNDINYKIRVLLPELLAKKTRKAKKENNEFGIIEDDGTGMLLFLTMTGTVDDPVFKYDRKGLVQKIKEDLKEEKQTLKTILNEEFGWFKKDTTLIKKKKKEKFDDDYFIIDWDEDAPEEEDDDF
ncbi:MAG: AsmA-like C-terminal region-containing protein [Bacteroidota bacterium]